MPDSTVKYIIHAGDMDLANGVYYMSKPFYDQACVDIGDDGDVAPEDDPDFMAQLDCDEIDINDIRYHWATHPLYAHQYDSEAEARKVIPSLPTHCNPGVFTLQQALDGHVGDPERFPFSVKHMPSDEDVKLGNYPEPPAKKYIPYTGPPVYG